MTERRDEALRARYRALATEEPSAAIDEAIRAAARRAVASAPGGVRRSRAQRWAVPASIAAVLFLSFGVVMRMEQEVPPLEAELRGAPPAGAPAVAKPESRSAEAPVAPPLQSAVPEPLRPAAKEVAREPAKPALKEKKVVEAAPPPAALAKDTAQREAPAARPVEAPAPSPFPASPPAAPPPVAATAPPAAAAAPQAASPQPRAFSDAAPSLRSNVEEQRKVAPGRRDEAAGAAASGMVAPRAKSESFAVQRAATTATADRLEPWPDTPEKKLERIEELRKAGRDKDADDAIARFRREHPDFQIPEATWERIRPR